MRCASIRGLRARRTAPRDRDGGRPPRVLARAGGGDGGLSRARDRHRRVGRGDPGYQGAASAHRRRARPRPLRLCGRGGDRDAACAALAGRFGPAGATRIAALLFALALIPPAFAGSLPALSGATFALGLATGLLDVAMNAHASRVEGRAGRGVMSSFHAGFSLGGLGARGAWRCACGLRRWRPARGGRPRPRRVASRPRGMSATLEASQPFPRPSRSPVRSAPRCRSAPSPRCSSSARVRDGRLERGLSVRRGRPRPAKPSPRSATPPSRPPWSRGGLRATRLCAPSAARPSWAAGRRSPRPGLRSRSRRRTSSPRRSASRSSALASRTGSRPSSAPRRA